MIKRLVLMAAAVVAAGWTAAAAQSTPQLAAPQDAAPQQAAPAPQSADADPDAKVKALLERTCSSCHGLDLITPQARTPEGWKRLVDSMADRGATATDAEFDQIVAYLAKTYPSAPPAGAAPASPAPAAAAPAA